jgi:tRNA-2-methylthio-N6-dimethylallyladenosine synthase
MAQTPTVMPSLHMPLQSGSDKVLRDMRRSYRQKKFLGIIERVRAAMPDAAITTDIIVGFPGETEEDFQATLDVVRAARFAAAFTFQYSKRPGTPAAVLEDQVPADVVKDRYQRLVALVDEIAWQENKALVGREVELMVAEGEGRKDAATHRLSGRGRDNRLVHFTPDYSGLDTLAGARYSTSEAGTLAGARYSTSEAGTLAGARYSTNDAGTANGAVRPGDMVTVEITYAAPHHLVADGPVRAVRRTRAGDAWERRTVAPTPAGVGLGMPTVGVPAPLPDAPACGA